MVTVRIRGVDAADGFPIRNQQLSYIDMFGYIRRDSETRPSGYSSVTLPTNPAPSYDSGVGYTNGTLHFGDRDGTSLCTSSEVIMYILRARLPCKSENSISGLLHDFSMTKLRFSMSIFYKSGVQSRVWSTKSNVTINLNFFEK